MSALVERLRAHLGHRLGYVVKTSGKTHAELAEALGMHQTTLSACIRGERFSVERIAMVLEQLGHVVEFVPLEGEEGYQPVYRQKRGTLDKKPVEHAFVRVGPGGSMGVKTK